MKSIVLTALLVSSFSVLAGQSQPTNPNLKKTAMEAFLKEANNPQSVVAQTISAVNEQNTDGRNPEGSIKLPVTKEDIQVARLSTENMINPWHYASKSDDGKTCTAGGDSAEFLILLASEYGVHGAHESETVPFKVRVSESLSATRKDGAAIEYCEDVAYDEQGEYVVAPVQIQLDSISALNISEK